MSAQSDLALVVSGAAVPAGELALSGPSLRVEPSRLPVRGDLAHIRLAGRVFVPHYAVPMPMQVTQATTLRKAGRVDGEAIAELPVGEFFAVLDLAGAWAWGQASDEGGLVGYVAIDALEQVA